MNNGIVHIRIDSRLIHGQVVTQWVHTVKATRIMIIDDNVVNHPTEKYALKMASPAGIKLSILTEKGAIERILQNKYAGQSVLLIVRAPSVLRALAEGGVVFDKVTVGNMSSKPGSKLIRKSVSITKDDLEDFRFLKAKGINIVAQMIPTEHPVDFWELTK